MGKTEDMRRLREQRAAADSAAATAAAPVPRRASTQAAPPVRAAAEAPAADAGLCGHTSISGRSCTRERDHQKAGTKNHRYG